MHPVARCVSSALILLASLGGHAAAQAADSSSLDSAILEILRARGIISDAEYEELATLAREQAGTRAGELELIEARLTRLRAPDVQVQGGTPSKLLFKSEDGRWTLGIKGQVQARVEHMDSDDDTKDGDNISVPRARLAIEGIAGAPNVKYRLQVDAGTNSKMVDPAVENSVTTRDVYVDIGFLQTNSVRMGQFKFPMGREQLTSHEQIDLQDLSIATTEFTPSYEPAVMASGTAAEGVFEYQLAVANGEGRGKNNTPGEAKNGMRSGARAVWNPLGAVKLEGPAFQTREDGSLKLGLGASWMRNEDSVALNTVTTGADTQTAGFEVGMYAGPIALLLESFHRVADPANGGAQVKDNGGNAQVGWLFTQTWEAVARYSLINFGAKDDQEEATVGLNWYLDKHNGKWMFDVSRLTGDGVTPDAARMRLQYQVLF